MILNVHYFKKKSEGGDFAQCVCWWGEGEAGDTHPGHVKENALVGRCVLLFFWRGGRGWGRGLNCIPFDVADVRAC